MIARVGNHAARGREAAAFAELDVDPVKMIGARGDILLARTAFIGDERQGGILIKLRLCLARLGWERLLDELDVLPCHLGG